MEADSTTEAKWQQLYGWVRHHHHPKLAPLTALLEAMMRRPPLRQLYPFTSHFTLCLSAPGRSPVYVMAEVVEEGQYRVFKPNNLSSDVPDYTFPASRILNEADAELAADLMVEIVLTATQPERQQREFIAAVEKGDLDTVTTLLQSNVNVNSKDVQGWTPLMEAAFHGHHAILQALLDAGADVDARDSFDSTALQWAASHGHTEAARILIEHGADVNAKDRSGETALYLAIDNGRTDIVNLLVKAGAMK